MPRSASSSQAAPGVAREAPDRARPAAAPVLPSTGVHRLAGFTIVVACTLGAHPARAGDPRDLFGLQKPAAPTPLDCADGTAFGCALATDALADAPTPFALATWLPASYLLALPVADATHDAVAGYALGAGRDEAGLVLGGATGVENRWTVDGAPVDSVRSGAADAHIPLVFLDGILVTAGGFGARDRTSTGGTIEARLRRGGDTHVVDAYAWLGMSAPGRARPTPDNAFTIRSATFDAGPSATVAVVASGPLGQVLGGRAWYAAGIAPDLAIDDITWRSHRIVDHDGDGSPDGFPGQLATEPIDAYSRRMIPYVVPAMLRVGWARGPHGVELTLLGQGAHDTGYLGNATLAAAGVDRTNLTADGIATYRGTWPDTHAKVQLAWHHTSHRESAADPAAADTPQILSAYLPADFPDAALVAGCAVGATAKFSPCPVPTSFLASGGAGLLTDTSTDRPTVSADVAHRLGANVIRAGVTDEDARLSITQRYTGGEQIRSLFVGHTATIRFVDPTQPCPEDPARPCTYADRSTQAYRTRYTAGYVEDTFTLAPGLVANGGLRWELDQVGGTLVFRNEPAPRLGVAWDPLGGGRSRLWVSMGRSYALLAAGLGPTVLGTAPIADDQDSAFGLARNVDLGGPVTVARGIEPLYQDEVTAGAEASVPDLARVTAWVQARYLRRGFDTDLNAFDNPGHRNPGTPEALRDAQVYALEIATPPAQAFVLRAGYTYTQVTGTWTGPFDPRQGAVLYAGSDFDADPRNQLGRLPTDLAHRLFVEGGRRGHLGPVELGVATRLTVASGRPRSVLANSDEGIIELLPRGSDGRLPMVSQANLRLSARWRGTDFTLDLFDLFDHRTATLVGDVYVGNQATVRPIVGGRAEDLVWLRTADGLIPDRDPSFRLATAFQSPFAAVLGARRSF